MCHRYLLWMPAVVVERHCVRASGQVLMMKMMSVGGKWKSDNLSPERNPLGQWKFLVVVNLKR